MMKMTRRQVVTAAGAVGLGLVAGCGPGPWQAQPATTAATIGYLQVGGGASDAARFQAFQQGLREFGYLDGQNIRLEYREGTPDQLPELAAELVRLPVTIVVTVATQPALAALQATRDIPIVMATGGDPVANGLVGSLAHPGGNITGLTTMEGPLWGKRIELLRDTIPQLGRLAILWYSENPDSVLNFGVAEQAAHALRLEVHSLPVRARADVPDALAAAAREPSDALLVVNTPVINSQFEPIAAFALSQRLPSMSGQTTFTDAGGLMMYGPSFPESHRRAAYYVDRILKGAKPADLPVEQPTTFDFVINLKTAQALGLTIPQHVLLQATEVIQ